MFILPVILLLVAVTIATPTADFDVLHRLRKRTPACYDADLARDNLHNAQECLAAIKTMPQTQVPGASASGRAGAGVSPDLVSQFSNAAPGGSPFRLPRFFVSGRCYIGVSMVSPLPRQSEYSSWNQIARTAVDIVRECVLAPTKLGRGGTNHAGRSNGILIEVFGRALPYPTRVGSTAQGAIERVRSSVG